MDYSGNVEDNYDSDDYSDSDYSSSMYSNSESDYGFSSGEEDDAAGGAGGAFESNDAAGGVSVSTANPNQLNAMRYIKQGSVNRSLIISRTDSRMVYIMLDGAINIALKKHGGKPSTITCKRINEKYGDVDEHSVLSASIPLVTLESGTIISLSEECFSIADNYNPLTGEIEEPIEDKRKIKPSNSIVSQKLLQDIENSRNGLDDSTNPINIIDDDDKILKIEKQQYDLLLTFVKPTTYIAVPYNIFRAAMREKSGHTTISISRLIIQINNTIIARIEPLLQWLYGNLTVEFIEKAPKIKRKKYTKGGFTQNDPQPIKIVSNITELPPSELVGTSKFKYSLKENKKNIL